VTYIPPDTDLVQTPAFIPTEHQCIPQLRHLARIKLMHFDPILNLSQFIREYGREKRKDDGRGVCSVKEVYDAYNEYLSEHEMKRVFLNGYIKKIAILHHKHLIKRINISIESANLIGIPKKDRAKFFTINKEHEYDNIWNCLFNKVR
jgi:hypothetical protein